MDNASPLPQKLMVLIALLQGLALLLLHQSLVLEFWPYNAPQWLMAFYSVALVWPVMLLLGITGQNLRHLIACTLPFAVLCGALGFYTGLQLLPALVRYESVLMAFVFTISLATFKALMYSQQVANGERVTYSGLFRWSWRNALTLLLSLLFAACLWGVLLLCGALFAAIDIPIFENLLFKPWFYYPVIALANGFGVIIFRRLTQVIDTITRLQQALMKFLLVVLILVSVVFLVALPFKGLTTLWASGGSTLILWMQAILLFFVSAVYQDDPSQRPYSLCLHRFIYIGLALLPIYSVISMYGLHARIDQYGWSLMRCWAVLIWSLLTLLSLGYVWGILTLRDHWLQRLGRVNVAVGLLFLAAVLVVNSPLLDFRKITVASQLSRLASGETTLESLDTYYFKRHLAKPGYDALQHLKQQYAQSHPDVALKIDKLYRPIGQADVAATQDDFVAKLTVLSDDVPQALIDTIYHDQSQVSWRIEQIQHYYLRPIDLNTDAVQDYVLVIEKRFKIELQVYYWDDTQWRFQHLKHLHGDELQRAAFIQAVKRGDLTVVKPVWHVLEVDGERYPVK